MKEKERGETRLGQKKRVREGDKKGGFGTFGHLSLCFCLKNPHNNKQNKCKGMNASNTDKF
jgi:hypothetical protein